MLHSLLISALERGCLVSRSFCFTLQEIASVIKRAKAGCLQSQSELAAAKTILVSAKNRCLRQIILRIYHIMYYEQR